MDFLISPAYAANGSPESSLLGLLPLVIIFVLFYFLLIRPQTKRAKEHKNMVAAVAKGDEVVTNGGILGRVNDIDESFLSVEIADGIVVKVQRQSIMTMVPKGTYKPTA